MIELNYVRMNLRRKAESTETKYEHKLKPQSLVPSESMERLPL